jgi:hypothetical protein
MKGGYIMAQAKESITSFKHVPIEKLDCLADDSVALLNLLQQVGSNKFTNKLKKFLKPFDENMLNFISEIKEEAQLNPVNYQVTTFENIFAYILEDVDINKYRYAEKKGSRAVNAFTKNFKQVFTTREGLKFMLDALDITEDEKIKVYNILDRLNFFVLKGKNLNEIENIFSKSKEVRDLLLKKEFQILSSGENINLFTFNKTFGLVSSGHKVLSNLYNFGFLPSDVFEELASDPNKIKSFQIVNMPNNNFLIIIPCLSKVRLNKLVYEIIMHKNILKKVSKLLNLGEYSDHNLQILLSSSKKIFPKKGDTFTARNINSAEFYPMANQINLFRKEELSKLLFHEMGHKAKIEKVFKTYRMDHIIEKWSKRWAVDRPEGVLLFTESVTEAFAQVINIIVSSKFCKKFNHSYESVFNYFWLNEIKFGLYQTAKILYLSGFKSVKEFFIISLKNNKNNKNNKSNKNSKVRESTSAVEYHIFKTIIMLKFQKFFNYHIENRGKKILELVENTVKEVEYIELIDTLIDGLINSFDNKIGKDNFLWKTGRMSLIERNIV